MAFKVSQGFERTSNEPIDTTLVMTKSQMANVEEALMPESYFCVCSENGKFYIYNKQNDPLPDTGKFKEYVSSSSSGNDTFIALTDARVDEILAEIGID